MLRVTRFRLLALAVVLGIAVASVAGVTFSSNSAGGKGVITAIRYSDVVRFTVQSEKVSILRAEVFDLGGKRLFDSGPTMGNALDWAMTTEAGERVAHGVYLYVITAWDSQGELVKSQVGKLALVPGGVGLGQAPLLQRELQAETESESRAVPLKTDIQDDLDVHGNLTVRGHGTVAQINPGTTTSSTHIQGGTYDNNGAYLNFYGDDHPDAPGWVHIGYGSFEESSSNAHFQIEFAENGTRTSVMRILANGNVGIGTTNPSAALEVHGSTTNLLALYDPDDGDAGAYTPAEFRVTKSGDVYADGAYYGASFNTNGGADVAERINTSEWVEEGNVVEIDLEHPGFFRKTLSPYSTNVAGVISTSPGVVLGNDLDAEANRWEDNRPMLALAGRVPVKVTTENGPIQIGDLLVSSSTPGYAMRCSDRAACVGATIGKALEPLEEGTGTIMVQVMLR